MRQPLRLATIGLLCMLLLSSLASPPDMQPPQASLGLAIQQVQIGGTIAGLRLPSLIIPLLLIALPAGYWLSVRHRLRQKQRSR